MGSFFNLAEAEAILAAPDSFVILQPRSILGSEILDEDGLPVFTFDATISESHQHGAEITSHPVEEGVDVADHKQIKPFSLSLVGIVTNTPTDPISIGLQRVGSGEQNRIQAQYEVLVRLFESKTPVTVVTGLASHDNMLVENLTIPRGAPRQDIRPSIEFKQITFASTVTVPVPANILALFARSSGQTKKDKGTQSKKDSDAATKARFDLSKDSLLKNVKEGRSLFEIGGIGI